jgi:predicted ester cyclase
MGRAIFEAFGEVHVEIIDTIVEGDRAVERHKATAISKGPFMGRAPTGKPVTWTENHIYRLRDGLIAETWSEVSFHDVVLNQLGPGDRVGIARGRTSSFQSGHLAPPPLCKRAA